MPKIKPISGKKLLKALKEIGFVVLRTNGSHHYISMGEKCTVIPVHGNSDIGVGLLRKILRDIDISVEEYDKLI